MKNIVLVGFALVIMFAAAGTASADAFGIDITIPDMNGGGEDNETEPGTIQSQSWDLEGVFLDGNMLSMIGGYNFATGQFVASRGENYRSGDIFIDVDPRVWGTDDLAAAAAWDTNGLSYSIASHGSFANSLGWDYAIRMNFLDNTYLVWQLGSSTLLQDSTDIRQSNPWRVADGQNLTVRSSGSFNFQSGLTDAETGFSPWDLAGNANSHYAVGGFDLGFLGGGQQFTSHYTMECGNDLLMGQGTTAVPEPTTLLLLGIGLGGLALKARKRR